MCSWGKLWTNRKKTQRSQLLLLKSGEQKQGAAHGPCTHHHQKGGQTTQAPLNPNAWTRFYPYHIYGPRPPTP